MIIREDIIDIKILYDIEKHFEDKNICFFDIETTGLSRMKNNIYLIGLVYKEGNSYKAIQWLDDNGKSEKKMIESFIEVSAKYDVLINYNGNSFDIPFIEAKAEKYGFEFNIENFISFDIYKEIHRYKLFFGLDNLKQKSIELFLRIFRTDEYDGGRLIEVYYQFLKNHSKDLLNLLLLHNYDDICGLVEICDIFSYVKMAEGDFLVNGYKLSDDCLIIECNLNNRLKVQFSARNDSFYVSAGNDIMKIQVSLNKTCLKFFYTDYKNSFYLPDEDMAIHKSVAQFVDKEHRIKAIKANCYIKKDGIFIKEYSEIFTPVFKSDFNDRDKYFEIDNIKKNTEHLYDYVVDILKIIIKKH